MAESKEFIKALFVDWANYYRCSGSPTKTKDVNKACRKTGFTLKSNCSGDISQLSVIKKDISFVNINLIRHITNTN
jgi:hypothetical protein